MNSCRCILFDLDGTLTDSKPGIIDSYRAALRGLGHEPDPASNLDFVVGPTITEAMETLLDPYGDNRISEGVALHLQHYGAVGIHQNTLYDGVRGLLSDVRSAGRRLYLATTKPTEFATRVLKTLQLDEFFDGIYGSQTDGSLDDKPALVAHIVAKEAVIPTQAIMVGDRRYDISGAHSNGIRAIGVLWGYGSRSELEEAGADLLVQSPAELASALLRAW